jgi:putative oxidoreductase
MRFNGVRALDPRERQRPWEKPMNSGTAASLGLLVLRLGAGFLLLYGHGWGKLVHFAERAQKFSDPIGIGSPASLTIAVFAEVFCSIAVMLGLFTRAASLPIIGTLGVAGFIHHAADPFGQKEKAFLFVVMFVAIALTGAGRYSLDAVFGHLWSRKRAR